MPSKSRRGKGKHPHYSRKSKAMMRQSGAQSHPQAIAEVPKPAATVEAPVVQEATKKSVVDTTPRYPYVTGELKRIGILAGIIIVILIVLSIVL